MADTYQLQNVEVTLGMEHPDPYPWMASAACRGMDEFLDREVWEQKATCAACPATGVDGPCVSFALKRPTTMVSERHVWGGLTEPEIASLHRSGLRRARRAAA